LRNLAHQDFGAALDQIVRGFEEFDIFIAEGDTELQFNIADKFEPNERIDLPEAIVR
jgi:hypothetical protein